MAKRNLLCVHYSYEVLAFVWGFRKKIMKHLLKKLKKLSRAYDFPFHLFHEHSPPCKHTHKSTVVIQGDKVDIVSYTVVFYPEILGNIKIEFLPLISLDTKAKESKILCF